MFFHEISKESKGPSMRTNSTEYHIWVAVEKDCVKPGCNSLCGYCTCAAGLLRCWDHVIFLFMLKQQFVLMLQSLQLYFQNEMLLLE